MCQRKIPPWQQEYCQQSQTQVAEEEGMGVDVEWPMSLFRLTCRLEDLRDLSMNVYSPSPVKAFCSPSLSISHSHVHFQASWPESPVRTVSHSAPRPGQGSNSLVYSAFTERTKRPMWNYRKREL